MGGAAYTYDNNGNLMSGGGRSYTWTAENLPASITSGTVTENYTYDADNERVAKAAGGATTIYFQGVFEQTVGAGWKQYYSFNGQTVAMRDNAGTVTYLHGDHLGSVSLATNSSGALASQQEFDPWGAVRSGGVGQVVDCAMVDGAAILSAMTYTFLGNGQWRDERGVNLLDSGTHFYDTYETSDGKWISLGSIEPQFYALLLEKTGLKGDPDFAQQMNPAKWGELKDRMTALILTRTRDEWCALMDGTDICFAPVLSLKEAPRHPHNVARGTFVEEGGMVQPAPAPRFSATPAPAPKLAGR